MNIFLDQTLLSKNLKDLSKPEQEGQKHAVRKIAQQLAGSKLSPDAWDLLVSSLQTAKRGKEISANPFKAHPAIKGESEIEKSWRSVFDAPIDDE